MIVKNEFKTFDNFNYESFLKELDIDLEYVKDDFNFEEKEKMNNFISKIGEIKHINYQNNSVNGAVLINGKRHFFKILSKEEAQNELKGFFMICGSINVANIEKVITAKNIVFLMHEYDYSIRKNEGLLNDLFVKCENRKIVFEEEQELLNKTAIEYTKSWGNTKLGKEYPMEKFYLNRIYTRLIPWYENESWLDEEILVNDEYILKPRAFYDETIEFFKNQREVSCILTQGDPNCMNIGIKPIFFDYATSGYNPIEAEIAAMVWSIIFADLYLCPKYHKNSYNLHEEIYNYLNDYIPYVKIQKDKEVKKLNIKAYTSQIRKDFVLKIFKKSNVKIYSCIKYYLLMRLLCIFNINTMDEKDKQLIIGLLVIIYYVVDSKFDIEKLLNIFEER